MVAPTVTYILFLLLANNPNPTVSMMGEFPTKDACHKFILALDIPNEQKARLVCQGMVIDDMSQPELGPTGDIPSEKKDPVKKPGKYST